MATDRSKFAATALTRFGVGARPGELDRTANGPGGPREWLQRQITDPAAFLLEDKSLPSRADAAEAIDTYRAVRKDKKSASAQPAGPATAEQPGVPRGQSKPPRTGGALRDIAVEELLARTNRALTTPAGFAERLVWFWSNHFTVAAVKLTAIPFAGLFEREAIRQNMTGRFAALHLAVMRHPGMLLYLDQAQSVGPGSRVGERRDAGLNENLAREALELHTLGPDGGYSQADVTEFARALTGWTIVGERTRRFAKGANSGDFLFISVLHEPGARTVMGRTYAAGGEAQARAILADLARHPATARRIATKLARHFIADQPPATAVAHLEKVYRETDGDLPSLHAALADLPEAWAEPAQKLKSPNDFLISALRATGLASIDAKPLAAAYALLGQAPFRAPSPEGWPDDAASWGSPDAILKRLEWSEALAARIGARAGPMQVAAAALGARLTLATKQAIERAESQAQGLVLALMSPEFQRR